MTIDRHHETFTMFDREHAVERNITEEKMESTNCVWHLYAWVKIARKRYITKYARESTTQKLILDAFAQ